MAEQLTITIPEDLGKRLKAVRESVGNVSAIATRCIEHAVKLAELEKPNISHIKRLRGQKQIHDEKYFKMGEEEAISDFEKFSYEEFIDLISKGFKSDTYQDVVSNKKDFIDDTAFNLERFMEGWFRKIKEQFNNVKSELK